MAGSQVVRGGRWEGATDLTLARGVQGCDELVHDLQACVADAIPVSRMAA